MTRSGVILMGDPQVARVRVQECGEPLVHAAPDFPLSSLKAASAPYHQQVRAGVHARLLAAQDALPAGYRLCWVEGFRRAAVQHRYFTEYRAELARECGDAPDAELDLLASRHVSPPAVAPHVSGAAVDLTLCDDDGTELDLGSAVNATPEESQGRCYFDADVSREARHHRAVLAAALSGAGLVNYPTEWWHWSYGDRYWALQSGARQAIYGPVPQP